MPSRRSGVRVARHTTDALVLRRVGYGESDLVVTLFTCDLGKISALARAARKSQKRFGGGLEPFHTLSTTVEERDGRQLATLSEATLRQPRLSLTSNLPRMESASRALGWLRVGAADRQPEPAVWASITELLDALDQDTDDSRAKQRLASFGLALLGSFGWGLELERCVSCGRPCGPSQTATVDPVRGGLVCRSCGGGSLLLRGSERARIVTAARGDATALQAKDAERVLTIVDEALRAHTGAQ